MVQPGRVACRIGLQKARNRDSSESRVLYEQTQQKGGLADLERQGVGIRTCEKGARIH